MTPSEPNSVAQGADQPNSPKDPIHPKGLIGYAQDEYGIRLGNPVDFPK